METLVAIGNVLLAAFIILVLLFFALSVVALIGGAVNLWRRR